MDTSQDGASTSIPCIYLKCGDADPFAVPENIISKSQFVKNMIEDMDRTIINDPNNPIPIIDVDRTTLDLLIEYCRLWTKHGVNEVEEEILMKEYPFMDWELEFFSALERDPLFDVLNASDYMEMLRCRQATCSYIAGKKLAPLKTTEEMSAYLNVDPQNDFTAEERERLAQELDTIHK